MPELQESGETGKNWPHGQREFRPPLSPAMRALLEDHTDETYHRGRSDGRSEVEREFVHNGIACLLLGMIAGAGGLYGLQLLIDHLTR